MSQNGNGPAELLPSKQRCSTHSQYGRERLARKALQSLAHRVSDSGSLRNPLSSTGLRRWPARALPLPLDYSAPHPSAWRDFNPPDSCATQHNTTGVSAPCPASILCSMKTLSIRQRLSMEMAMPAATSTPVKTVEVKLRALIGVEDLRHSVLRPAPLPRAAMQKCHPSMPATRG